MLQSQSPFVNTSTSSEMYKCKKNDICVSDCTKDSRQQKQHIKVHDQFGIFGFHFGAFGEAIPTPTEPTKMTGL